VTLLCESGRGYANLCRILTAAHAGTRRPGREDREPLPPSVPLETVAELNEGLVCLSGARATGSRSTTSRAQRGSSPRSVRAILRRAAASVRARRHAEARDAS
jgi:DNA polymerase III alpha subunit